jgi:hypothetical protein
MELQIIRKIIAHWPRCYVRCQRRCKPASPARKLSRAPGRQSGQCAWEATVDKLRHDCGDLQFKAGECVEDCAQRATTIANQLQLLGDKISDKEVIKKILHFVPEHLEQVAISIETMLDLNSMSFEVATDHLWAV